MKTWRGRGVMTAAGVLAVVGVMFGAVSGQADNERLERIESSLALLTAVLSDLIVEVQDLQSEETMESMMEVEPVLIESDMYGTDCHFRIDEQAGITGNAYATYEHGLLLTCHDTTTDMWDLRSQYGECSTSVNELDGRLQATIRCW